MGSSSQGSTPTTRSFERTLIASETIWSQKRVVSRLQASSAWAAEYSLDAESLAREAYLWSGTESRPPSFSHVVENAQDEQLS